MSKKVSQSWLNAKSRRWLILLSVIIFAGIAFVTAADGVYNQTVSKIAKSTNNLIVLPQAPERSFILGLDLQGGTQLIYEANVENIPEEDRMSALEGVRDIIERRVNVTGVSEPVVQVNRTIVGDYRIIAELAGIKDVNEAIRIIGETPILEFKEQDEEALSLEFDQISAEADAKALNTSKEALSLALGGTALEDLANNNYSEAVFNSGTWLKEADDGELFAVLSELNSGDLLPELWFDSNSYQILQLLDSRVSSNPFLEDDATNNEASPEETEYLVASLSFSPNLELPAIDSEIGWKNTELTGKNLKRASLQFNPNDGSPEVSLEFDSEGSSLFADITGRNIGQPVAIFLDGYPISVPTVNESIPDGQAIISGQFNVEEARLLVQRLNTGALPVPITLVGQQTVGASLGQKSINSSLIAGLFGFLLVSLFMLFYYRLPGLLAVVSLATYVLAVMTIFKVMPLALALVFIILLISLFTLVFNELKIFDGLISIALFFVVIVFLVYYAINPVTLTLAGITGFILSIGMAVDANILIFERMREELKSGKPLGAAIDEGFRRAWPSIRDGNITTILVCFVLMTFGTGLVKGFGATLFIGVSISMFSSIVITRILLRFSKGAWLEKYPWLLGLSRKNS